MTNFVVTVYTTDGGRHHYEDASNHVYDEVRGAHVQLRDSTRVDFPIGVVLRVESRRTEES